MYLHYIYTQYIYIIYIYIDIINNTFYCTTTTSRYGTWSRGGISAEASPIASTKHAAPYAGHRAGERGVTVALG